MNICYSGYWGSYSGMGQACRNIIVALHTAGVNITTEFLPNISSPSDLGAGFALAKKLHGKDIEYPIKILHTTPDMILKYLECPKYHIFHLFWETDKVDREWVWMLNKCDEIWTGSEENKKVFKDSGVKIPIWVCPQPVDGAMTAPPFTNGKFKGRFLFYSIFQWIERKDPKSLLQAYWREFQGEEGVGLLLKVYKEKFTNEETLQILAQIMDWKKELNQSHYPAVYVYPHLMSRKDVYRLHATGDCFVLAHRGEGFGIPIGEAMLMGKPVISTNKGGIHEIIPPELALLIDYQETNVFNMNFASWYHGDQKWGQVNVAQLREKMRYVFSHQKESREMGAKAQAFIKQNLSFKVIGERMKNRLEEIVL